ncbi:MAG TPA: ABC transporter permease [Acidobacteriaceae bacterium]|jgi:predicted permease
MERFLGYFRFSIRQLRKSPSFAIAAVVTLALGIGATTAIFSLVNAVLLKPLPFPEPDRLLSIKQEDHSVGAGAPESLSYPDYFDWRVRNRSLSGLASFRNSSMALTGMGEAQQLGGKVVSSNFFQVLGVAPILGGDFRWDEEHAGNRAVMLSYELWQSRFGGANSVAGQQVTLDGERYTIAGVMPKGFHFPLNEQSVDAWASIARDAEGADPATRQRGQDELEVVGRLKPGVTVEQARADLSSVARGLAAQYSDTNKWYTTALVVPELEHEVGKTRPALEMLFGAVALLLLIACVNVAGLLLVRSSRRSGEIALRSALGASRSEIVWQLLTESVVLSVIGGLAGIALASGILKEVAVLFPQALPRLGDVSIDLPVLAFAMGVSVGTGILFGVAPALRVSSLPPALVLRDGTRTVTTGRAHHRLQTWLVIGETALGLVLLVGAGLLIRSFVSVLHVDPGFDAQQVLTARFSPPQVSYPHDRRLQFVEELLPRLSALPGVKQASAGWPLPMSGSDATISFTIEGHPLAKADHPSEGLGVALPGYFETMRIPLIAGRTFTSMDRTTTTPVAIIDQAFAKKYFPGVNPVGRHITADVGDGVVKSPVREIVGVVGNIKQFGLTAEPAPHFYLAWTQAVITDPYLCIRATGDPAALERAVRATIAGMDANIPTYRVHPLDYYVAQQVAPARFQTLLLTAFAAIALLLAAVGLYGVLAYIVQQRALEIALRLAVGAQRGDVLRMVLRRGMTLAALGVAAGLGISFVVTRFLATLLYGVKPLDALTFCGMSLVLLAVALVASVAPAYRAAQTDPMTTLRTQ